MFNFLKKGSKEDTFQNFGKGKVVALSEVPDKVFAEKMMGDGYALELSDGKIYAPVDGTVAVAFPTGHAYGITTKNDIEILIHIGIDTVELDGKGFNAKVKQNDKVKAGDLLTEVDLEYIKNAGKPTVTPMIFTSENKIEVLKEHQEVDRDTTDIFKFID